MKTFYATLIGVVAWLMVVPLALAGPPSWDEQINTPSRFKVLKEFNDEAVLDKETGLVWEQAPHGQLRGEEVPTTFTWSDAHFRCNTNTVGGRKGWRLPTIQELASLVDPNNPGGNPDLPPGHPFSNVQSSLYWSATTYAVITSFAWFVPLNFGDVASVGKSIPLHVWCVRGGQGVDPQ